MTGNQRPPENVATPAVHLACDTGMDSYTEPYPRFSTDGSNRAGFIPGRSVLHVLSVQGDWVQVSRDDESTGWVKGSQLIPPIGSSQAAAPAPMRASMPLPASQYVVVAARENVNGFAVAALTLGIIGATLALTSPFGSIIGIVCSILGLIFGLLALRNVSRHGAGLAGLAIAGVILGSVAVVISSYQVWTFYRLTNAIHQSLSIPIIDASPKANDVRIDACYAEGVAPSLNPFAKGTLLNTSGKRAEFRVTVAFHAGGKVISIVASENTDPVDPGQRTSWFAKDLAHTVHPTACTLVSQP